MRTNPEYAIHDGYRDSAWRKLLEATIGKFLAPGFDPRHKVSALTVAHEMGMRISSYNPSVAKVDLYAPAAAAIHLQTRHWLTGTAARAQVRPQWIPKSGTVVPSAAKPVNGIAALLRDSYFSASVALEKSGTTHLSYFLQRFDTIGARDIQPHANSQSLRLAGTLTSELANFTNVTARALQETPATSSFSEELRVDAAHKLLIVSTSRAAQHLNLITSGQMSWLDAERSHPHIEIEEVQPRKRRVDPEAAQAAGHAAIYRLLGPDGRALFPAAMVIIAAADPTVKCPAHQRLAGAESALQSQMHAGVNRMAEHGVFHPDFVIPPPV